MNPNQNEEEELDRRLGARSLRRRRVLGDGNCQFRALALMLLDQEEQYMTVRQSLVAYIRNNPNLFANFVPGGDLQAYCNRMESDGMDNGVEWGDNSTLQAAADLFGVRIIVVQSRGVEIIEIEPRTMEWRRIFLAYFSEQHYDATKAIEEIVLPPWEGGYMLEDERDLKKTYSGKWHLLVYHNVNRIPDFTNCILMALKKSFPGDKPKLDRFFAYDPINTSYVYVFIVLKFESFPGDKSRNARIRFGNRCGVPIGRSAVHPRMYKFYNYPHQSSVEWDIEKNTPKPNWDPIDRRSRTATDSAKGETPSSEEKKKKNRKSHSDSSSKKAVRVKSTETEPTVEADSPVATNEPRNSSKAEAPGGQHDLTEHSRDPLPIDSDVSTFKAGDRKRQTERQLTAGQHPCKRRKQPQNYVLSQAQTSDPVPLSTDSLETEGQRPDPNSLRTAGQQPDDDSPGTEGQQPDANSLETEGQQPDANSLRTAGQQPDDDSPGTARQQPDDFLSEVLPEFDFNFDNENQSILSHASSIDS